MACWSGVCQIECVCVILRLAGAFRRVCTTGTCLTATMHGYRYTRWTTRRCVGDGLQTHSFFSWFKKKGRNTQLCFRRGTTTRQRAWVALGGVKVLRRRQARGCDVGEREGPMAVCCWSVGVQKLVVGCEKGCSRSLLSSLSSPQGMLFSNAPSRGLAD